MWKIKIKCVYLQDVTKDPYYFKLGSCQEICARMHLLEKLTIFPVQQLRKKKETHKRFAIGKRCFSSFCSPLIDPPTVIRQIYGRRKKEKRQKLPPKDTGSTKKKEKQSICQHFWEEKCVHLPPPLSHKLPRKIRIILGHCLPPRHLLTWRIIKTVWTTKRTRSCNNALFLADRGQTSSRKKKKAAIFGSLFRLSIFWEILPCNCLV